jgi:hypothetical protein
MRPLSVKKSESVNATGAVERWPCCGGGSSFDQRRTISLTPAFKPVHE